MTVYNAELYLREAIDSVLRQDFEDFEFIIINDGSPDGSQKIVDTYAQFDKRIVPVQQKNMGLVASLNKGIKMARGEYIARMDSDDVCLAKRFSDQIAFLEANPAVVLLGGGFEVIDSDGYHVETIFSPLRDKDIQRTMLLRNPFGHASVMYRKDAVVAAGLYSDKVGPTEDYELWIRIRKQGKIAALPRPLYRYRINFNGISQNSGTTQADISERHAEKLWKESPPSVLNRKELLKQSRRYIKAGHKSSFGVAIKHQFLADNAQIGVKFIRHGQLTKGLMQLLAVATTGRLGLKLVAARIKLIIHNLVYIRLLHKGN